MKLTQRASGDQIVAVITVPAYFNDAQLAATKGCRKVGTGLDVKCVSSTSPWQQPWAAGLDTNGKKIKIMVYD